MFNLAISKIEVSFEDNTALYVTNPTFSNVFS